MKALAAFVIGITVATSAAAQTAVRMRQPDDSAGARRAAEQRYQIGQMERVLEGAVEHGVTVTRDRLQALAQVPADLFVSDNAHARGFRLEGYGVFFDVVVPSFYSTLTWSLRTLDQNDLGLDSALRALQSHVKTSGDPNLEQALKRIELQMNPSMLARSTAQDVPDARNLTGSAATTTQDKPAQSDDPILENPNEAYRTEVVQALKDAMLAHSSSLGIGPDEWLTIAAKGNDDRPRLAPADSDARTRVIRLRGADLADFLAGRLTRDEALQRIEVRVF
jgi:sarcosine oxidase gamma subunit